MAGTILVIDDESNMRWVLQKAFQRAGYEVYTASRGSEGLQLFARHPIDLVLLDLKMPGMDGLSLLRELRSRNAETPILLFTAYATVATAVEALKVGATDYIRKPFDIEAVLTTISHHLHSAPTEPANPRAVRPGFGSFIGVSPLLNSPLAQAMTAARNDYTTLLYGEPGSGRRHLAQLIHQQRQQGRLVVLDCAGLPAHLLERELLESVSAEQSTLVGQDEATAKDEPPLNVDSMSSRHWQQALGGSLLLANCDRLPTPMLKPFIDQITNYLRTPQRPHGLRLFLTATEPLGKTWHAIVQTAIQIELPPLRHRIDDLYLLLAYFAPNTTWDPVARARLNAYDWPGNVAELERITQQVAPLALDNTVHVEHLPRHIRGGSPQQNLPTTSILLPEGGIRLETVEQELIHQALARTNGNKAGAARLLGLTRATLLYRMDKYNIQAEELVK